MCLSALFYPLFFHSTLDLFSLPLMPCLFPISPSLPLLLLCIFTPTIFDLMLRVGFNSVKYINHVMAFPFRLRNDLSDFSPSRPSIIWPHFSLSSRLSPLPTLPLPLLVSIHPFNLPSPTSPTPPDVVIPSSPAVLFGPTSRRSIDRQLNS